MRKIGERARRLGQDFGVAGMEGIGNMKEDECGVDRFL